MFHPSVILLSLIFFLTAPLEAQEFSYNSTVNESMSKFHRIGHIEGYLDNLDKKMQRFESKIDEKQKKSEKKLVTNFEGLKSDIASLKKEVTALKVDEIPSLKKLIEEEEDSKGLAELVQKQQTQLEALKNEVASLQTLVKSLIKMQQASGEVKSRGRLAPRKSP